MGPVESFVRRAARGASALGVTVWEKDTLVYPLVLGLNLFFARHAFAHGLWADNDSVGHLAYATYLKDEFYPQTGTFLGFCPRYNLGLPFLLFNTPPLLYVVTATTAGLLHVSVLASLKGWMVAAFLAVPVLGAELVATFDPTSRDLRRFGLLAFSLFSSELFGLEFFFNNGMLNPALAVPLMLATLVAFRRAVMTDTSGFWGFIVATAACFALTLLTHALSAWMVCVGLFGIALGAAPSRWAKNVTGLGLSIGLGAALAGFWLYPSAHFASTTDAAYTWIRDPWSTFLSFLDGSLISSYWGGFFRRFRTQSNVGLVAVLGAGVAVAWSVWRRQAAVLGLFLTLVLALWITMGPRYAGPLAIVPLYDRLLWYRFVTLVIVATLTLGAFGAWQFARYRTRLYPLNPLLVLAGAAWAFVVMVGRAEKIQSVDDYPQFQRSVATIAQRLNARSPDGGRLYSEFLAWNVVEASSVNYPREMLPILTGLDEVGGWIYENNPASQSLMRRGPFWYNPIPILELADRYDVEYIVAGTPEFVHALANDARWETLEETPDLVLFHNKRVPSFAEAAGYHTRVLERRYLPGGGYHLTIELDPEVGSERASTLLVKTNYFDTWHASIDGAPGATASAPDGLLMVPLPARDHVTRVDLDWRIEDLRRIGDRISLAALAAALSLLCLTRVRGAAPSAWPTKHLSRIVAVAAVGLVVLLAWRARPQRLARIGSGIADGMETVLPSNVIRAGTFDDDAPVRPNRLLTETAWGPRSFVDGHASRALDDGARASLTLAPSGSNRITVDGVGSNEIVTLRLFDPRTHQTVCTVSSRLGSAREIPAPCLLGERIPHSPGVARELGIDVEGQLSLRRIEVQSGIIYLEAESFRNVLDDDGDDASYALGAVEYPPSNGATMSAEPQHGRSVIVRRELSPAAGTYSAWVLLRSVNPRLGPTRGTIGLLVDGQSVGVADGTDGAIPFWESHVYFDWERLGLVRLAAREHRLELSFGNPRKVYAGIEVDELALVPEEP